MGRLRTKQAGVTAAVAIALAVATVAITANRERNGSLQTVDGAAPRGGSTLLDTRPPSGGDPTSANTADPPSGPGGAAGGRALAPAPADRSTNAATDRGLVPAGFRIGYRYTDADAPSSVVISRFDFTEERTLFTAPPHANYTAAEWSPARDRILIGYCVDQSPCSIRTVGLDGVVSGVLDTGSHPSWSPDGRWILETKPHDDGRDALFVIPSTGGDAVPIGASSGGCCGAEAKWAPDSFRVAFADPQRHVLRIATRDGKDSRSLSDPKDLLQNVSNPVIQWSPDGQSLMVERLVRDDQADPATARPALAAINVKSGRWQELGEWHGLEWAPDSQSVIVHRPKSTTTTDRSCGAPREIGALSLADGTLRGFGEGCSAKLSPDRRLLAVSEINRARVIELAGNNDLGAIVYESDGGFRSRSAQLLCCTWTPGSDALVLTDAEVVVARIDGRARWQHRS